MASLKLHHPRTPLFVNVRIARCLGEPRSRWQPRSRRSQLRGRTRGRARSGGHDEQIASTARASVVATKQIDGRLLELTVSTPALASDTKVRVLLPTGYTGPERRRYPVLYLLHGAGDNYSGWTRSGDSRA